MEKHASLIFVLGGARSGKSNYALELAWQMAGDGLVLFIATAQAGDEEMAERIAHHRSERPDHWQTLEAPQQVGMAWRNAMARYDKSSTGPRIAVLDCITLLVSNVLFADGTDPAGEDEAALNARLAAEIDDLLVAQRALACPLIVVSNEVGMGIVPANRISRLYRDLIGRANRRLAAAADHAVFLVAGVPLDLKKLQADLPLPVHSGVQSSRSTLG